MLKKSVKLARPELLRDAMYIGGEWRQLSRTFTVTDPATTADIGNVPEGDVADVKDAIKAAKKAFPDYAKTTARYRSDLLRKWAALLRENSHDLGLIVSLENGKPLPEAQGEIIACAQNFEWFSEEIPHYHGDVIPSQNSAMRLQTVKQPVGVCGIITPWNFPASMIARKVGAALAAGCTTVVKPAAETPLSALAMAYLGAEAGIPSGVVNVVTTDANVQTVGEELCSSPLVSKVTFTGSTATGKKLMGYAATTVKKVSFELGGNAPFIVFEDADVDKAVQGALASKFRGSGQTCICANRFYVHEAVYDEFVNKFSTAVSELKPGHGIDPDTRQGPLINERSMKKVTSHVENALTVGGGKLLTGGHKLEQLGPNFYAPTVISECDPSNTLIFREETFGPVAAIAKFAHEEDMLVHANDVEVGLAAYMFTRDVGRVYRVAESLEVGMVGVNTGLITEVALPFGGVKESGFGREGSKYGLDDYMTVKTIAINIQ